MPKEEGGGRAGARASRVPYFTARARRGGYVSMYVYKSKQSAKNVLGQKQKMFWLV